MIDHAHELRVWSVYYAVGAASACVRTQWIFPCSVWCEKEEKAFESEALENKSADRRPTNGGSSQL